MALKIESHPGGAKLFVKVVPGSSRDRIVGQLGEALKVAVAAPPEGGKANQAVTELLAEALGVAKKQVSILSGHSNPRKQIVIQGMTPQQVESILAKVV